MTLCVRDMFDKILSVTPELLAGLAIVLGLATGINQLIQTFDVARSGASFIVNAMANAMLMPACLLGIAAIARALQDRTH